MEVMVGLGRLGEADYEGMSVRVRIEAGESRKVRFTTTFRAAHPALKLQAYVAGLGTARGADLMADSLCVGSLPPKYRSDESRAGKEGGRTCRCQWSQEHEERKSKQIKTD